MISGVPLAIDAAVRLVCWGVFVAKSFSFGDAKRLLRDIAELQRRIRMAPTRMDELKGDIVQEAEALKSAELTKSLLELPVEDLNKYKKGLRTSLLRENGYTSIAHVQYVLFQFVCNIRNQRILCS